MAPHSPESSCLQLRASIEALQAVLGELAELQPKLDQAFGASALEPALLQRYNQLLDSLAQADSNRISALKLMDLAPQDMEGAFARCELPHLSSAWASVRQQLPQLALTNRKHAQFLHKATASIQTGLGLLGAAPSQPPLYGPSGQKEAALNTRTLGSA